MGFVKILSVFIVITLSGCATNACKMAANYHAPQTFDKPFQVAQAHQHDMAVRECSGN